MDISPNTIGSRLGVATVQASTRLETILIRPNQYTLAIKSKVYEITTTRRSLSSTSLVETYENRLPSVLLTVYPFF
jgi:hypothetical protein